MDERDVEYEKARAQRRQRRRAAQKRQLLIRRCMRFAVVAIVLVLAVSFGGSKLLKGVTDKTKNKTIVEVQAKTPDIAGEAARQPIKDAGNAQKMATTSMGWQRDATGWWYQNADGSFLVSGWQEIDGQKYYFGENGYMITGWKEIDGIDCFFQENGQYDAAKKRPMVALTFDDGPGKYTDRLLDCLEENKAKATFFMLGQNIEQYPEQAKREQALGMEIGNHTYDHKILTKIGIEEVSQEVSQTNDILKNLTGQSATVMRPPGGAYNGSVLSQIGLPVVLWSIDTKDWKTKNTQNTIDVTLNNVTDGSIVLMHDIHEPTVEAALQIIPALIEKGYKLVTVSELAKEKGIDLTNNLIYSYLGQGEEVVE